MKLTIFGSTGQTGLQVVSAALAAGHEVTALVRHTASGLQPHSRLRVLHGQALSPPDVGRAIHGCDAVLSALGSREGRRETFLYSRSASLMLDAMRNSGVRRIIAVSALPLLPAEQKTFVERRIVHPLLDQFFGGSYDDMRRMEVLHAVAGMDWTVLRPPRLTNGRATGSYREALDSRLERARSISRADLAAAMVAAVDARRLIGHAVTIAH
jgi:putative NADH-flavin reductase